MTLIPPLIERHCLPPGSIANGAVCSILRCVCNGSDRPCDTLLRIADSGAFVHYGLSVSWMKLLEHYNASTQMLHQVGS